MVGGDTLDILSSQFHLYFSYTLHFSQFASLLQVSPYLRANLYTKISHLKTLDSLPFSPVLLQLAQCYSTIVCRLLLV